MADPWVPGRKLRSGGAIAAPAPPAISPGRRDDWFAGIDVQEVAAAALDAATGCEHVDVRITNSDVAYGAARDEAEVGSSTAVDRGLAVRVVKDGRWGFAAGPRLQADGAVALARRAVAMAEVSASLGARRVELAPAPVLSGWWASPHEVDPFDVPAHERMELLTRRSAALLADPAVSHAQADYVAVRERVLYADSAGSFGQQQRIRVQAEWTAVAVQDGRFETMRTLAPPSARGWEYLLSPVAPVGGAPGWDFDEELAALPELLAGKAAAPSIEPGEYDLILDPTHLWLTIHESVGHATELDRSLGYEANYAGTSFALPEHVGSLSYGSALMNVTGDRVAPHGLATAAFDDEGVPAQSWDLIRGGTLTAFQLDRAMAAQFGLASSNGCAYADSYSHVQLQRMPNVSLRPGPADTSLDDLIASVDDGLLLLGDNSWSIDMQRYNFQFTPQRTWRIRRGEVVGQVRDVAYQSSTPDFWHSLSGLGGARSYMLGGAINCGKGQPGQTAAVSHGAPAALFDRVRVLNTAAEAGAA